MLEDPILNLQHTVDDERSSHKEKRGIYSPEQRGLGGRVGERPFSRRAAGLLLLETQPAA